MPWTLRMTLLIAGLAVIFMIYNSARIYWYSKQTGLHSDRRFWAIFGMIAVLFFAYPVSGWLIFIGTGSFSTEWYPIWIISLFWYGFIFNAVLLSWILTADILNIIVTYLLRVKRPQFQTLMGLGVLTITVAVFLFTSFKTFYDSHRITVENITINHPAVKDGNLDPLRIVHISEMHADRYTSPGKMARYMRKVEQQKPDIVLFTGDLISSGLDYLEVAASALASVYPPMGVHFVVGDHDFWSGQDEITEILESKGVNVVQDKNMWLQHGDGILKLTGITEVYSKSVNRELLQELLNNKVNEDFSILFSHQAPEDIIQITKESGTDMLLAGHTHGGQIRIPVFFKKLSVSSLETDYVIGHWQMENMLLNINSGLGFTLAPLRYNSPAEISVIDVK